MNPRTLLIVFGFFTPILIYLIVMVLSLTYVIPLEWCIYGLFILIAYFILFWLMNKFHNACERGHC